MRGYYEYKVIWVIELKRVLACAREKDKLYVS